ncbi:MAG: DNA polymerase III subunit delta' [Candidatus Omnitrophota bacterium]|nr:DNA polymerase III subunit delta' [Candidatus Omnitrophota bacterium]
MAWSDILGQEFPKRLLQAHLCAGRVAHAYLLAGPDGVGKGRVALEMAKTLNCVGEARPCDACGPCRQIARRIHPDVHFLEPTGASEQIRMDDIRSLMGRIALRPFSARAQVAILADAQRLTEEAANSLLKVLEEPSARSYFFLTTSRLSDCLPTIVSRCQLIRCQPLPRESVRRILVETQGCDPRLAEVIARLAAGSASAAVDLAARWTRYERIWASFAEGPASSVWLERPLPETRQEVAELLDGMMEWVRDLAVAATVGAAPVTHAAHIEALRRQALVVDLDRCLEAAWRLAALRESLEQFVSPRLVAALAREEWLSLFHETPVHGRPSTVHREEE